MSYIFWKLLLLWLILAINKDFLSILQGIRILLTRCNRIVHKIWHHVLTTFSLLWSNSLTWLVPFLFVTFFFFFWKYKNICKIESNPAGRVLIGTILIVKTWIWTKNSNNWQAQHQIWNPNFRDPETCFIYIRYIIMQIYPKIFLIHLPNYVKKAFNVIFHCLKK